MIRIFILIAGLSMLISCKGQKEIATQEVYSEETEVAGTTNPAVLDLVDADAGPASDCREEWRKKDREILYDNKVRYKRLESTTSGIVYIIAKVNRKGEVIDVEIDEKNTTVEDKLRKNFALEIVSEYIFEPSETAPKIDCGIIIFALDSM